MVGINVCLKILVDLNELFTMVCLFVENDQRSILEKSRKVEFSTFQYLGEPSDGAGAPGNDRNQFLFKVLGRSH